MSQEQRRAFLEDTLLPALNIHYNRLGVDDARTDDLLFCLEEVEEEVEEDSVEAEALEAVGGWSVVV
jgi:hypothetical protein